MIPNPLNLNGFTRKSGRFLIVAALTLAVAAQAEARPPRGEHGPPSAERQVARMSEHLDLTDAQSAELLTVLQRADADREALRETMEAEFKPDICALHDRVRSDVASVLEPDQLVKLEEFEERRAERAAERGRRGPPWADCNG